MSAKYFGQLSLCKIAYVSFFLLATDLTLKTSTIIQIYSDTKQIRLCRKHFQGNE